MSLLNFMPNAPIEDKEKLEEEFLAFLHDLDYPEDAVFRGPSFQIKLRPPPRDNIRDWIGDTIGSSTAQATSCYADLAILDLQTCEYAALVEFRLHLDEQIESQLANVFQAVLESVQTRPPAFLVIPGLNSGFRIFQLRENGHWQELPKKHFPHYATLAAGFAAEKNFNREFNETRTLGRFAMACRIVAGAVAVIALSSMFGLSALTIGQILLVVLAAVLVIAPDALNLRSSNSKAGPKLMRLK